MLRSVSGIPLRNYDYHGYFGIDEKHFFYVMASTLENLQYIN